MIAVWLLCTVENSLSLTECMAYVLFELCVVTFMALPFYHKKWHGLTGYFKELWRNFKWLVCVM